MKRIAIVMLMLVGVCTFSCTASDGKVKQAAVEATKVEVAKVAEAMDKSLGQGSGSGSALAGSAAAGSAATPALPSPTPAELAERARVDQDQHNLAARYVHAEVPNATCTDYYQDVGSNHAYSVRCVLQDGHPIYATVDTTGPHIADLSPKPTPPTPAVDPKAKAPGK